MKLEISIVICALLALSCTAAPADAESDNCALCSQFLEMMNVAGLDSIPSEYKEFLDTENLAACLASCNSEYAEGGDSVSLESPIVELVSMVGCTTCNEMMHGIASHLMSFDIESIKYAVKNSCSTLDGMVKKIRCNAFVKARLDKIVDAVFHYHVNSQAACLKLSQC